MILSSDCRVWRGFVYGVSHQLYWQILLPGNFVPRIGRPGILSMVHSTLGTVTVVDWNTCTVVRPSLSKLEINPFFYLFLFYTFLLGIWTVKPTNTQTENEPITKNNHKHTRRRYSRGSDLGRLRNCTTRGFGVFHYDKWINDRVTPWSALTIAYIVIREKPT